MDLLESFIRVRVFLVFFFRIQDLAELKFIQMTKLTFTIRVKITAQLGNLTFKLFLDSLEVPISILINPPHLLADPVYLCFEPNSLLDSFVYYGFVLGVDFSADLR